VGPMDREGRIPLRQLRHHRDNQYQSNGLYASGRLSDQHIHVILQTIPLDGKIVLRPPKDESKQDTERAQQSVRDANDRRREGRRDR
jgi:hypothetical protein